MSFPMNDLAKIVRPGETVMWGQACAEPVPLTSALLSGRQHVGGRFRVFLGAGYGAAIPAECADWIDFWSYCGSGNQALAEKHLLEVLPCHYSELPKLIRCGLLRIDVLLLQVAPPNRRGYYSLGLAHEYLLAAVDTARVVVAEVNEQCPWTYGERDLSGADIDIAIPTSRPPQAPPTRLAREADRLIALNAASLIEDRATLQIGMGALPEAILAELTGRRDLGVHSGMIGDGVAGLMEAGVITNACKKVDRGLTVAGTVMGGERIQRFVHRNPDVSFRSTSYTHAPEVLAAIDRLVAINSAIEVDISGQINAEVANERYVGAVGGVVDFLRGAARSNGGLPIVALPSLAGESSRIVTKLSGPTTIPRSDAGIVVTEFGIADLRGASIPERARRLIAIAHPRFRESLERAGYRVGGAGCYLS